MALTSTWTQIGSGSQTINGATLTYIIEAKLSSQSTAENKSYIDTRARTSISGSISSGGYSFSCTGCATKSGSSVWSYTSETVLTGSTAVSHADDGTGALSMSGACTASGLGINISASGSIALPDIARASKPTVSKQSMVLDGSDSVSIYTNRKSTAFSHTIRVTVGTHSQDFTGIWSSFVFRPTPSIWMPYMTSSMMTATVTLTTYNGNTQVGSPQTCTFRISVDTSEEYGYISAHTITDTNSKTLAIEPAGTYISGASLLRMSFTLQAHGSYTQLARAVVTYGAESQTYTLSGTSQTIVFEATAYSVTVSVAVTDARGYTTRETFTLTVANYMPVSLSNVKIVRANSNGSPSDTGSNLSITADVQHWNGPVGGAANQLTLTYEYRIAGSSGAYTAGTQTLTYTTTGSGQTATYPFSGLTGAEFAPDNQYDLRIIVSDALTETSADVTVHEGLPVLGWGQRYVDIYGELHVHSRSNSGTYISLSAEGLVIFRTYSYAYSGLAAGSNLTITANQLQLSTPNGYTPMAIQKITTGYNNVGFRFLDLTATGSSTALVLFNSGSSSASSTVQIIVAYVYTGVVGA